MDKFNWLNQHYIKNDNIENIAEGNIVMVIIYDAPIIVNIFKRYYNSFRYKYFP